MRLIAALMLAVLGALPALASESLSEKRRDHISIESRLLGETREILVHLPVGYEGSDEAFPVVYITDAEAHMDHTSATAGFLYNQHLMPKVIIVGVVNTNRNRDLRPTPADQQGDGVDTGADRFLQFFEQELMPEIGKRYRVLPYRVLSGTSFGGLFTMHAFVTKPSLFDAYIAVSPSLWWDGRVTVARARQLLSEGASPLEGLSPRKLYLSLANEPQMMRDPYTEMIELLAEQAHDNLSWSQKWFEEETHNSTVLLSEYQGLSAIFDVWGIPDEPQTLSDLLTRYAAMSAQVGGKFVLPEDRANGYGQWLFYTDRLEEATQMFEWNVATYPASANARSSLGLAYEKAGRLQEAKAAFEKAVALSEADGSGTSSGYQQAAARVSAAMAGE